MTSRDDRTAATRRRGPCAALLSLAPLAGFALLGSALGAALTGCSEDAPPVAAAPPPPPPPRPAAPPAPKVTPIADLMARLSIDERIVFDDAKAPDNDDDRIAILEFFDAFARGDAETLQPMLADLDRRELKAIVDDGMWRDTVKSISEITLETGMSPHGDHCVLAIFDDEHGFEPQLWYYSHETDGYRFEAVSSPPDIVNKLSGDDWIGQWHALLEQELALANQLDVDIEVSQLNLDESDEETRGGDGGPSLGGGGGGGGPGGRRPPAPKRKPPGAR